MVHHGRDATEVILTGVARLSAGVVTVALLLIPGACGGDVARLPDCIDCRPVEMSIDQPLEVELGSDRAVSNDPDAHMWTAADTGTMKLVSEDRGTRPEDESEFIGGYSRFAIFTFEATKAGTTQLRFELVPTSEEKAPAASTLDITVNVRG